MRFTDPLYALLFLPILGGLIFSWRHVHGMAKARKYVSFVIRGVLASSLVLALMGPQLHRPNEGLSVVFAMDRSDSISDKDKSQSRDFVNESLDGLGQKDSCAVVVFGRDPAIESSQGGRRSLGNLQAVVDASSSDLASAVRLSSAVMSEGRGSRIVLMSDGNETAGDVVRAVEAAVIDNIELDVLALGVEDRPSEAAIIDVQSPSERQADEPFEIRVIAESTVDQNANLVIDRDGVVLERIPVVLPAGRSSIVVEQRLDLPGFYRYRATLEPGRDSDGRNNFGTTFVSVQGRPRVLLLEPDPSESQLALALQEQGIEVDLFGTGGVPISAEDLQPYNTLILNDFNAALMAEEQMELIKKAVRDTGLGLIMVGGENSYLPGGYYGTPVAEALPVDLNIRQRKSYPSTTVLVVVDASGSMAMMEGGMQKIQLAAKAAAETARMLSPRDRLGVAGSTNGIEYVAPISELTNKAKVISNIKKLRPGGGGIFAEMSMKFAEKELTADGSKVRHLILVADGADTDTYGTSLEIASKMRAAKITTSVVAIGDGKDVAFLKALAAAGGGQYYLVESASRLPAIFTQDVAMMGRSAIEELTFIPEQTAGEEIIRGLGAMPALHAYCLADARPLAQVGLRSPKSDPILATWQYGLGRSMAFTSDAQARWAAPWMGWDGFSRFWGQAVRWVSQRRGDGRFSIDVSQSGGRGSVRLEAVSSDDEELGGSRVIVSGPGADPMEVDVIQEAPGVYTGEFDAQEIGSYIITVSEDQGTEKPIVNSAGMAVSYPPEYRAFRQNSSLLNRLVELSGGRIISSVDEALRPRENPGVSIRDLWVLFVMAAFLLLPLDVGVRRIALPFAEAWQKMTGWLKRQREVVQDEPERLARLRKVRESHSDEPEEKPSSSVAVKVEKSKPAKKSVPQKPTGDVRSQLLANKRKRRQDHSDDD